MLYKMVLTFKFVEETVVCEVVLSCGNVHHAACVQGGSTIYTAVQIEAIINYFFQYFFTSGNLRQPNCKICYFF